MAMKATKAAIRAGSRNMQFRLTSASEKTVPQNPHPAHYEYVDAESIITAMSVADSDTRLDTAFHAHYARIARVIGSVIHDQARAQELAVDVILKWWRRPGVPGAQTETWLYRTAVREALDEWRRRAPAPFREPLLHVSRSAPHSPTSVFRKCPHAEGKSGSLGFEQAAIGTIAPPE